jgi:hypothetical protein
MLRDIVKWTSTAMLVVSLVSCARVKPAPSTHIGFKPFIPPAAQGFDFPKNYKIVVGAPIAQAAPGYPPALIARRIPRRNVCLEIEIDAQGKVYHSPPLHDMPGCPISTRPVEPAFVTSAEAAVMHWRFAPTVVCMFPADVDADAEGNDCADEGAKIEPLAIRLAFAFTFTTTNGKPKASVGALSPQR